MGKNKWIKNCLAALVVSLLLCGCASSAANNVTDSSNAAESSYIVLDNIPEYTGSMYVTLNDNIPEFVSDEYITEAFEYYSDLDPLGRCGVAYANICKELMPTEERGQIGSVKPSGWHTVKYNNIVEGNYLYNRCHLIGFQLAGENANEKNLITGTRSFNVDGMLPFENQVAEYIEETGHHVLYRVTPIYEGNNLVATGVQMEAASVEDETIRFNVFVYNVQTGITIDYSTGESWISDSNNSEGSVTNDTAEIGQNEIYILNKNSKKFHLPDCEYVDDIKLQNRSESTLSYDQLIEYGNEPCKRCLSE